MTAWRDAEILKLHDLVEAGFTVREIAAKMKRSDSSVRTHCIREKLEPVHAGNAAVNGFTPHIYPEVSRYLEAMNKPSPMQLAMVELGSKVRVDERGHYRMFFGQWREVSFQYVMRAANKLRHERGEMQIQGNPAWEWRG